MALISVLWGIALLSLVAASLLSTGATSYQLARNGAEMASVEVFVEAAVNRAVLALLDQRPQSRWRGDGAPHTFTLDGATQTISIQDELGRIDLNHADGALLSGLLMSAGLDRVAAEALVDKVLDWREPGASKRINGAKAPDYRMAGLPQRPRNGPFQSVSELRLVMGMSIELFKRIAPALTVYSGRPFIDPGVAPAETLLALPGMDAAKVAALVATRTAAPAAAFEAPAQLAGRAFAIRTSLERRSGALTREVVVRLTDNPAEPYWMLEWRREP